MQILASIFVALLMTSVCAEELKHSTTPVPQIKNAVDEGKAVIVDVREKSEWDTNHVKGAIFLPLSEFKETKKAPAGIPKDKPVFVHCAVGRRAMAAAEILKTQGYDARPITSNVDDLAKGGFVTEPTK